MTQPPYKRRDELERRFQGVCNRQDIRFANIDNTSADTVDGGWGNWWGEKTGEGWITQSKDPRHCTKCCVAGCPSPDNKFVGGHVWLKHDSSREHGYIVPLCSEHNSKRYDLDPADPAWYRLNPNTPAVRMDKHEAWNTGIAAPVTTHRVSSEDGCTSGEDCSKGDEHADLWAGASDDFEQGTRSDEGSDRSSPGVYQTSSVQSSSGCPFGHPSRSYNASGSAESWGSNACPCAAAYPCELQGCPSEALSDLEAAPGSPYDGDSCHSDEEGYDNDTSECLSGEIVDEPEDGCSDCSGCSARYSSDSGEHVGVAYTSGNDCYSGEDCYSDFSEASYE